MLFRCDSSTEVTPGMIGFLYHHHHHQLSRCYNITTKWPQKATHLWLIITPNTMPTNYLLTWGQYLPGLVRSTGEEVGVRRLWKRITGTTEEGIPAPTQGTHYIMSDTCSASQRLVVSVWELQFDVCQCQWMSPDGGVSWPPGVTGLVTPLHLLARSLGR